MALTLSHLLERGEGLLCVSRNTTVKEALSLMIEHDFSQLPVVDENDAYLGVVSEQVLVRTYYHLAGENLLSGLTVDQCRVPGETLPPDYDLVQALDRMRNTSFVVVVDNRIPVGIITFYDTTEYFREFSEGLMLIQDIELKLREHIEAAFPTESARTAALHHAFGRDKRDPTRPAQEYEDLTLREHVQLITTERNWPEFDGVFEPKHIFQSLIKPVIAARNQLVHFRGQLSQVQMDALERGATWMKNCPVRHTDHLPKLETVVVEEPVTTGGEGGIVVNGIVRPADNTSTTRRGKYAPLADWLKQRDTAESEIRVRFEDIEKLLGDALPPFSERRNWWANDKTSRSQSIAWLSAGWRVKRVDFAAREVTFERLKHSQPTDEGSL